ncbi:TRAP transporter small permease subunit [Aliiglaciecola sp. LCG003]|uniref:TRAP transporter small permease subunit n=1 Tax=Aliiglaciecola sp. LCG003 TaxID=3053655 RepID=UPI0025729029|nr:TRAP transporter small permease subunit [Aliiglaciecola sp. LCG003]WJG09003.1 TRAP transporter small permease subunit [Aliiglaciecola sp. LCG003]
MAVTQSIVHFINRLNDSLCRLVSWLTLVMVIVTLLIVVLRYGFDIGWIAMQESVMYMHAMVFLLGCAHTLRVNEHVRVDIFYRGFSAQKQAKVDVFGTLLFLLPVNIFVLLISYNYVSMSWTLLESSQEAGGLPLVFLLKSLMLIFALLMLLQGIAELLMNIAKVKDASASSSGGDY